MVKRYRQHTNLAPALRHGKTPAAYGHTPIALAVTLQAGPRSQSVTVDTMSTYPSSTPLASDSLPTLPLPTPPPPPRLRPTPQSTMARSCSEVSGRATALDQQLFEVKCEVQVGRSSRS